MNLNYFVTTSPGAAGVQLGAASRDAKTGLYCDSCQRYLATIETIPHIQCKICNGARVRLFLLPEDQSLVDAVTVDEISSRDWWHFSTRAEWPPAENLLVHLGSLQAALARVSNGRHKLEPANLNAQAVTALYFYRVAISATHVLPHIPVETLSSAIRDEEHESIATGQILRYVNFFEAAGKVSLMLRAGDVRVLDTLPIPVYRGHIVDLRQIAGDY